MTAKRPGPTPRRRKKSGKRGQSDRLAVLYFFLGLALAAGLIYFGQNLLSGTKTYLPAKPSAQATKPEPMLALVLDATGADQDQVRDIQGLKLPITILPAQGQAHTREVQDLLARAVQLDGEPGAQAAMWQLKQAERLALSQGRAVAVAHAKPETAAALASWSVRRDGRVKLVPLSKLIQAGPGQAN
jgi:polysaccharide deacetylase 2 family uncharacterized protein YibQ